MRPLALGAAGVVAFAAALGHAAAPARDSGLGGCTLLPQSDAFHQRVDGLDETPNSDSLIDRMLEIGGNHLHPDFGSNPHYGIPYEVVGPSQRRVRVRIRAYPHQSDKGKQPIPRNARIEGGRRSGGDRHVLVLQRRNPACRLIELYRAFPRKHGRWRADQVSVFDLGRELPQRPDGWTSADAAGLPILPGLVRYREVKRGEVDHAIRMTFESTRRAYLSPATHYASDECAGNLPPMGMRLRLDDEYPITGMSRPARVIAQGLQRYGAIVADNGSNFFITGASDRRWNDEALNDLKDIPGNRFEVVDTGAELTADCGG
jgi:hypothetical protein